MSSTESSNEMTWITLSSADNGAENHNNVNEEKENGRKGETERRRRRLLRLLRFRPGAIVSKWKLRGGNTANEKPSPENTLDSDTDIDENNEPCTGDFGGSASTSAADAARNSVLEYEGKHGRRKTHSSFYSTTCLLGLDQLTAFSLFTVTCPLGLSEGNTLFVQSPSNVRQFYASVPAGKLAGDVFRVHYRPVEKNRNNEDSESFLEDTEFLPCVVPAVVQEEPDNVENDAASAAPTSTENKGWMEWSFAVDNWLTPTPRIVGRPITST